MKLESKRKSMTNQNQVRSQQMQQKIFKTIEEDHVVIE